MAEAARWWLGNGEEECAHCDHSYAYEAEVRCVHCDAPMCPMCVVRMGRRVFCPGCAPVKRSSTAST